MTEEPSTAELMAEVLTAQLARVVAARELEAFGISPSPADVEAWLSATPRQRMQLVKAYAIYEAPYV
jgi:hypothetical protein